MLQFGALHVGYWQANVVRYIWLSWVGYWVHKFTMEVGLDGLGHKGHEY